MTRKIVDGSTIPWAFDEGRGTPPKGFRGKHCFVLPGGDALEQAAALFGRDPAGLCLKVFFLPLVEGEIYDWGRGRPGRERDAELKKGRISPLYEATVIQNLCWAGGYAPRVYGLLSVERNGRLFPAQLTDYLESGDSETGAWALLKMNEIARYLSPFGCLIAGREIKVGPRDFLQGKLIDFQGFRVTPSTPDAVASYVRRVGRYGAHHYQSVKGIGLGAKPRDTEQRIAEMHLDEIDFEGKTVLDVGCNIGAMCHYAGHRVALRVVGVDREPQVEAARVLAAYLGYWNVDFEALDVRLGRLDRRFDITFMLSMVAHVGFPEWVYDVTDFLVFEENAKHSEFKTDYWLEEFADRFDRVVQVGHTTDHNRRFPKPVIFAWRKGAGSTWKRKS